MKIVVIVGGMVLSLSAVFMLASRRASAKDSQATALREEIIKGKLAPASHPLSLYRRPPAALRRAGTNLLDGTESTSIEVDLRVRTIGLGSPLKSVRKRLGAATKQRRKLISDNTCYSPAKSLELTYSGMTLRLLRSLESNEFTVVSIEVEAPRWLIRPGLRVGMDESLVRARLGPPVDESTEDDFHRLHYVNKGNDGFAVFYFKDGKLTRLKWESALC